MCAQYIVQELEPLYGHEYTEPRDINHNGLVAGISWAGTAPVFGGTSVRAVLWDYLTLNAFNLHLHFPTAINSEASGVNFSGEIIGWSEQPGNTVTGFRIVNGVAENLPFPSDGDTYTHPAALNNGGEICGYSYPYTGVGGGGAHWTDKAIPTVLPAVVGVATATVDNRFYHNYPSDINAFGTIVGSAENFTSSPNPGRACVWQPNAGLALLPTFTGNPGVAESVPEDESSANAVNDTGVIVGSCNGQPAVWGPGQAPINPMPSMPGVMATLQAVNNAGTAVGFSWSPLGQRAVMWDGAWHDLNDLIDPSSGWTLRYATAINDNGKIVGVGDYVDPVNATRSFQRRGFLLTPPRVSIRTPPGIPWLVQWILFGVRGDQPGAVVRPGGGVTPWPPWNPDRLAIPRELRGLWSAYAAYTSAEGISDIRARREIQRVALEAMQRELTPLLGAWARLAEGTGRDD
jgi:hypothetical protein